MTRGMSLLRPRASGERRGPGPGPLDVRAIRSHFTFPEAGRIVTNNAASTQPPRELVDLYRSLAPGYENVHRGQSSASRRMTELFEESYDTIAQFIGAPGRPASRCTGTRPRPSTRSCTRCSPSSATGTTW